MKQYLNALEDIMNNGVDRNDRTGTGTRAQFGLQMRFNLQDGFPAVTTKKLAFKAVKSELLWFIEGSSDDQRLRALNGSEKTIWTANLEADYWKPFRKFDTDLGQIYGVQWRSWPTVDGNTIDQLANVIEKIKDPEKAYRRRLIVSAWHPGQLDYEEQETPKAALCPCHILFQFYVADGKLSLQMYQRSADMFLGVPFNIASYSLLLAMVAQATNLEAHEFIHVIGDAHIYTNHFDAVNEQLSREPKGLPKLWLNPEIKDIDSFTMDDIKLENYEHHPSIKAKMAV